MWHEGSRMRGNPIRQVRSNPQEDQTKDSGKCGQAEGATEIRSSALTMFFPNANTNLIVANANAFVVRV